MARSDRERSHPQDKTVSHRTPTKSIANTGNDQSSSSNEMPSGEFHSIPHSHHIPEQSQRALDLVPPPQMRGQVFRFASSSRDACRASKQRSKQIGARAGKHHVDSNESETDSEEHAEGSKDQSADTNEGLDPCSEKAVIEHAKYESSLTGVLPDFLDDDQGVGEIPVRIKDEDGDDAGGRLLFRKWDQFGKGYWAIEEGGQFRVVKYSEKDDVWYTCGGYSEVPIAWPMQPKDTKATRGTMNRSRDTTTATSRAMRDRKPTQIQPYTEEKQKFKRQKVGKKTSGEEALMDNTLEDKTTRTSDGSTSHLDRKGVTRSVSDEKPGSVSSRQMSMDTTAEVVSTAEMVAKTILYIRQSDEDVPVPLSINCTQDEFFEKLDVAWDLAGEAYHLVLSFPWKEKFASRMALKRQIPDTWKTLLDNISSAPCWSESKPCDIEAVITSKHNKGVR